MSTPRYSARHGALQESSQYCELGPQRMSLSATLSAAESTLLENARYRRHRSEYRRCRIQKHGRRRHVAGGGRATVELVAGCSNRSPDRVAFRSGPLLPESATVVPRRLRVLAGTIEVLLGQYHRLLPTWASSRLSRLKRSLGLLWPRLLEFLIRLRLSFRDSRRSARRLRGLCRRNQERRLVGRLWFGWICR